MNEYGTSSSPQRLGLKKLAAATFVWAITMATTCAVSLLWFRDWAVDDQTKLLIGIFAAGGLFGFPTARLLLGLVPEKWTPTQRFSSAFILFGAGTIGFTALFFALQFIDYYSQWHDDHASKRLLFETVFTILSACYQFLVLGLRLYVPFGLLSLIVLALAYAQRRI